MGDMLGSSVGGQSVPVNQNTMMNNTAGAAVGPTWGDVTRTAVQLGSSPGSSGPRIAGAIPSGGGSPIQSLEPPPRMMPTVGERADASGQDSTGKVLSLLLQLL